MMQPTIFSRSLHGVRLGAALVVALLGAWLSVVHGVPGPTDPQGLEAPPTFMPALLILDGDSAATLPQPLPAASRVAADLT